MKKTMSFDCIYDGLNVFYQKERSDTLRWVPWTEWKQSLIFVIQACANGDLEELQETLTAAQSYYNLDLNCKDQNGKSALVVALETENWACLELLLDNGVKIGDALLYAIKNKQVNAVKILFQKMKPGPGILINWYAD